MGYRKRQEKGKKTNFSDTILPENLSLHTKKRVSKSLTKGESRYKKTTRDYLVSLLE